MQLAELHRPREWNAVIGQDKAIARIRAVGQRGYGGRAWWLSGGSGQGKTTIARLIAAEVADSYAVDELDAPELTADKLRQIERDMSYRPLGVKAGRAWIVNEAHGLTNAQVRKLLTLLEPAGGLPSWTVFVFTTTQEGQEKLFDGCDDASPLLSRCLCVELARRDLCKPFALRAREIAQAAGLDGLPIERYERLAKDCRNNFRMMLNAIEAGEMSA